MADYPLDMQLVVDPLNPENVVRGGSVYFYDPSDTAGVSPIAIKDPAGLPLPNPLTSNAYGFIPPTIITIPRVKWKSGNFDGFFYSYDGLRNEAIAAKDAAVAAQAAATTAGASAAASAAAGVAGVVTSAAASAAAAQAAAALVGAPADAAIAAAVNGSGTATKAALNATIVDLHTASVAGTQTVPVVHGHTYELTATANAVVTLTGVLGAQVAIVAAPGAFSLNIAGTVATAKTYVAHRVTSGWTLYPVGGAPAGDVTAPTAGTLGVSVGTTTANLTVTGALDETALHATPYRYSKDNGATWSAWQAGATYAYTGLTAGTSYTFKHGVQDAAGNIKLGTAVTISTSAAASWSDLFTDNFTGVADGTAVAGRTTETGGRTYDATSTATITGQRAYSGSAGDKKVIIAYSGAGRVRYTAAYEISTTATSASVGFSTIGVDGAQLYFRASYTAGGTATLDFQDQAVGIWTATIPTTTGHPLTGTIGMEFNPAGKSGVLYINGAQVGTFAGDTTVAVASFWAKATNNSAALDNLRGEVSAS